MRIRFLGGAMKTLIKNARVVTKENIIENGHCIVENGLISSLGSGHVSLLENYKEIDAKGNYLIPGFVDLHCHGGNGYDFMDGTIKSNEEIASFHLSHGTTTLFLTTLCADRITTKKALETCKEFLQKSQKTNVAGVHLEGPCLNPVQCGAQKVADMVRPLEFNLEELVAEYPFIKRISIAPELDGANDLARKGKTLGLVLSIAHSDGDFNDVKNAIDSGYTLATHLYSGMNGVTRKNAYRKAGAVEGALYFDDMYVELIADGRHLPKELVELEYTTNSVEYVGTTFRISTPESIYSKKSYTAKSKDLLDIQALDRKFDFEKIEKSRSIRTTTRTMCVDNKSITLC